MKIVIATIKSWNIQRAEQLKKTYDVEIITDPEKLTLESLRVLAPRYLFFPHWSWIIPAEVYENFECVVFHMTDLPFGRGGSPLQNLIARKIYDTKISAIQVTKGIDAGPIYCKRDLSLRTGNAQQLLEHASEIIFEEMIPEILSQNMIPSPQHGAVTTFKRRTPQEGELLPSMDLQTIFDYIRMLDGEGYLPAYLMFGPYRLEFSQAESGENIIEAKVRLKRQSGGDD